MNPFQVKPAKGPEEKIQNDVIAKLKTHDWYIKVMFGNMFQFGVPDLYAAHIKYGYRWIEVKNPHSFSFTKAQREEFPKLAAHGVGIWILFAATDQELMKLFSPANWQPIFYGWCHGISKVSGYPKV
jgi:hypothetical protein